MGTREARQDRVRGVARIGDEDLVAGIDAIASGRTAYTSTGGDPAVRDAIARRYPDLARGGAGALVTIGSQ
ncbi:MAG TPA: hypothetical protein VJ826_00450, partial [Candidatus Polarisedimenticolaceae bacterium]|nr:hypothetical protein [Candidatus Polarisedimenticolaceae bacterium]